MLWYVQRSYIVVGATCIRMYGTYLMLILSIVARFRCCKHAQWFEAMQLLGVYILY